MITQMVPQTTVKSLFLSLSNLNELLDFVTYSSPFELLVVYFTADLAHHFIESSLDWVELVTLVDSRFLELF